MTISPPSLRRKIQSFVLGALLIACGQMLSPPLSAASPDDALQPLTLQLRWVHQFQFAGYYAAKQQGYYRDIGLDVNIRAGAPGLEPVKAVLNGDALYGVANSELLHQRLLGAPLVALAAVFQHSGSVILTKQESGIRTPQDLIGRRVMLISEGADVDLVAMLNNEGVDISQTVPIENSYDINDLIEDKVDAFNAYRSNEPFLMAEKKIPVSTIQPASYGIDFYSDVLFTSEQELKDHPDRVKQFREASLRGWQYAMDNPEPVIDLIIEQYSQAKSRKHLRFEAASMRDLIMPNLIEYGHMNPGRWKHMADTFIEQGMVQPRYDLDGFIYDPKPPQDLSRWYAMVLSLLLGLLLIASVSATLLYYNRKLRSAINYGEQEHSKLQQQTALFEAIFRSTPDATVITNSLHEIILCNPAFKQIFGYRQDEVISKPAALLYEHPEIFEALRKTQFNPSATQNLRPYEINYRRKSGDIFPSISVGGPIADTQGQLIGFVVVMRDNTAQKKASLAITRMALIDPLTELANRHQFNRRIEESIKLAGRQQQRLSLAMMDLDFFKQVNDQYGHPAGDALLKKIALILKETFRETDIIARIGGDEFAIIMIDPDSHMAIRQPAERVINALQQPLNIDGKTVRIGVSFGVATYPQDTQDPTELYRLADKALYHAKHSGRNRCSFANEIIELNRGPAQGNLAAAVSDRNNATATDN